MAIDAGKEYDVPTAVTFLLAGLGIGSLVTILLTASPGSQVAGIHRVSRDELSPNRFSANNFSPNNFSPNNDLSPAL
jgi:hypothetical protein